MSNNTHSTETSAQHETREMVCIVCPIGCRLKVDVQHPSGESVSGESASGGGLADTPEVSVTGNKCPRGEAYAREEVLAPKRTVTATCRVLGSPYARRVSVKTDAPLPVEHIDSLLKRLYDLSLEAPVSVGETVVENIAGTGINLLTTRSVSV